MMTGIRAKFDDTEAPSLVKFAVGLDDGEVSGMKGIAGVWISFGQNVPQSPGPGFSIWPPSAA